MEQPPASPPVFPNLPQSPNVSNEACHHIPNNDMMLPYISHMLMEDDIDNELSDHSALLQVQQPFAQILSSHSLGTNTDHCEGPNEFLHEGRGDGSPHYSPLSKGSCVVGAYLKGMEEANMLLPKGSIFRRDELVNQIRESNIIDSRVRKSYNKEHLLEEEVRTTNKAVMMNNELEEKCGMIDKMMLHVYETCIKGMESVNIDNTDVEKRNKNSGRIKAVRDNVVDIRRLLISCAQALAADNHMTARELLKKIKQHASATGDTTQRLAHCFAKGLEARILGTGSQLWQLLMLEYPSAVEFLKAYSLYSEACCFVNVTFIFSAMTIMQLMVGKNRLHIVDYGTRFGFQWTGLLRLLASKEGRLPEVKITIIARPKPICFRGEQIEKIGCRLMKCADELGLPSFKFHSIVKNWEDTSIMDLQTDTDEVLVVTDLFSFSILMEESIFFDAPSPRDTVLNNIKKMRPDVFIQNVMNCSYGSCFLSRFRETLFYYMALFDMLDTTMPRESESRLVLEKVLLGCYVFNGISCEGTDLLERPEKYNQWQTRNQRAGLRQLQLKSSIVKVVKNEVIKHYHKDFMICQDGQWLLQGWMGRVLSAHTTWVADEDASCG
ncbi:hypothetical protein BDA96_05G225100 [Sorghum bicolor]|uniref:GRAS family transcription factor n=3 Tax=Sorghum bicolor TaxID=4558 RepID=A0A921UGI8_SORBI|nr:hypothetical protein BDA96_05G225100 [Sorghum bicolor]OQU83979.1 hypothetical protein SORBI_3005G209100 [Sorghum bicolor]